VCQLLLLTKTWFCLYHFGVGSTHSVATNLFPLIFIFVFTLWGSWFNERNVCAHDLIIVTGLPELRTVLFAVLMYSCSKCCRCYLCITVAPQTCFDCQAMLSWHFAQFVIWFMSCIVVTRLCTFTCQTFEKVICDRFWCVFDTAPMEIIFRVICPKHRKTMYGYECTRIMLCTSGFS
jgi:hypothetical protein